MVIPPVLRLPRQSNPPSSCPPHWMCSLRELQTEWSLLWPRASSDFLKVADTQMHVCANFFHNLRKILAFERVTVKITYFNLSLLILTQSSVFYGLSGTFSCNFFLVGNFACAIKITFRKSGLAVLWANGAYLPHPQSPPPSHQSKCQQRVW